MTNTRILTFDEMALTEGGGWWACGLSAAAFALTVGTASVATFGLGTFAAVSLGWGMTAYACGDAYLNGE